MNLESTHILMKSSSFAVIYNLDLKTSFSFLKITNT